MLFALLVFAQIDGVQFVVAAFPDTVFVHQQVSYDVSLRLNLRMHSRFLESPTYMAPDIAEAAVYDFPFDTLRSIRNVTVRGETFKQYTYHRAIFPLMPGIDSIPPSTLTYTAINEADPYESHKTTVRSAPHSVVVLPLPSEGRPLDFSGAVGQFSMAMTADTQGLHTGTSFGVRVTVTGTGDVVLLQRPVLAIPWGSVVNTSDSVTWDSTKALMRGVRTFYWLVTPRTGGRHTIPSVQYSYFDPQMKSYRRIAAAAIPVSIIGPAAATRTPPAHDRRSADSSVLRGTQQWHVEILLASVLLIGVVAIAVGIQRRGKIQ